jgi:ElaB/YqjD/DUF883 family membrane-anchored ribosome-binding protein
MADTKERTRDAVDDGAAKAKETADTIASKAGEVIGDVRGYAGHVAEQSRQGYRQVAEQAQEGVRQAGAAISGNPGRSAAMAFGVGVALGVVIGMSMRPKKRDDLSSRLHLPGWLS